MATVSSIAQYYNLYDSTKGYTEILFRAGKVLQSKEVNEMQSMLKNQIRNVGDTILTNGDIVEGCQLIISDDRKQVTITPGKVYLNGDVRIVPQTILGITGNGTEVIGIKLNEEVITPDDDPDLLDVATGYDNYSQDGAYRLREVVEITVDDDDSSTLYTLVDGEQLSVNTSEDLTQLEKINATLARRTFDESGNYKVEGLDLQPRNYCDENYIYVTMESGRAYVKGYEVNKTSASIIPIERATTLRDVSNEPKIYRSGTLRYSMNNYYPSRINRVVATVEVTEDRPRDSVSGGIDYLPAALTPVVEVVSVVQGDPENGGHEYIQGTDFQVTNDGIDWSLAGDEPETGTSYTVTWRYNKTMNSPSSENPDYIMDYDSDTDIGYLVFTENGDKPVVGTSVLVNYSYMLCRRDVISLDKDGNPIVTKGQPDILRLVESPSVSSSAALVLGSTLVVPNSDNINVINNDTKAVSMIDLYTVINRISELELNQAISDLDNEAASGEPANQLEGVLTDGFIGVSKADIFHSEWNASIDMDNKMLVLPFNTSVTGLVPNTSEDFEATLFDRLLTAPASEITVFSQPIATGTIRVNSYNAFPKTPTISLNPAVDNWIDERTVTIQGGGTTGYITLRRWWYHKNESWAASEKAKWQALGWADGGASLGWADGQVKTQTTVVNSVVMQAITYMRQRTVTITGYNFAKNADNITATFNGVPVSLSPTTVAYRGTTNGTLKADADGTTKGTFTVPANTPCGTREVVMYALNTPSLNGRANYTANGNTRTTTQTVYTKTTIIRSSDPIAQSFQLDMDQTITGIGIYFKDKDLNEEITVQLRDMVNGYPGTTCYAEKVVLPSDIRYSQSGTAETKVLFDNPVVCEKDVQYCFTILSNSDVDSLFIAETNAKNLANNQVVTKNVYLNGMMFSSSNAMTWTAHQNADLKFNIYGARFATNGSVIFREIENLSIDRLMICSEEDIPNGCTIQWSYALNDDLTNGNWNPIESFVERELNEIGQNVTVKCELTATPFVSPALALDCLQLAGFKNQQTGTYVSRNVTVSNGFNQIKIVADLCIPSGCGIDVFYATDQTGTTWTQMTSSSNVRKSVDYVTHTFIADLDSSATYFRVKLVLRNNGSINRPSVQNLKSILKTVI